MHKQERRQGARNKEDVIEPRVKKNYVAMRLDQPAINGIQRAADEKQRIKNVSEPPHNNARIMRPNPKPSKTFNSRILVKITPAESPNHQVLSNKNRDRFDVSCKTVPILTFALSPTCKEAARLQSVALDRTLTPVERSGLRFHLLFCKWCRAYGRQYEGRGGFSHQVAHRHRGVRGRTRYQPR